MAEWFRAFKHRLRTARALREIDSRTGQGRPHGLAAPLIVSLTSYPARFPVLALTLSALLRQTIRPDAVVLWVAEGDAAFLPPDVTAFLAEGLQIRSCTDWRSYKKIIPTLTAYPDSLIVTADDDVYYGPTWLEELVRVAQEAPGRVVAHRAHRVSLSPAGGLAPYDHWKKNISGAVEGPEIFATGVGGVLYPPGVLADEALSPELFMNLCPDADDVWLYWMTRRAGSLARHVGPPTRVIEWPESQGQSLRAKNHGPAAGNDRALAAMTAHFGLPSGL
ncbi:MAG: glycosyltransferase family 2 protein [Cypionkella sp.]